MGHAKGTLLCRDHSGCSDLSKPPSLPTSMPEGAWQGFVSSAPFKSLRSEVSVPPVPGHLPPPRARPLLYSFCLSAPTCIQPTRQPVTQDFSASLRMAMTQLLGQGGVPASERSRPVLLCTPGAQCRGPGGDVRCLGRQGHALGLHILAALSCQLWEGSWRAKLSS